MGSLIAQHAVQVLDNAGIRAKAAWPGQKIPHLKGPAAAVCLEKEDCAKDETTILVTVYSPGDLGGSACEDAALQAMEALQAIGAECLLEGCRYDGHLHLFSMDLHAVYAEGQVPEEEEESLPITVKLGLAPLTNLSGFKSWHLTDDPKVTALSDSLCYFRIEELIPTGETEQNTPTEPFTITVTRGGTTETFTGCYLTSDIREDQVEGVNRVRSGTAEKKTYVSIL